MLKHCAAIHDLAYIIGTYANTIYGKWLHDIDITNIDLTIDSWVDEPDIYDNITYTDRMKMGFNRIVINSNFDHEIMFASYVRGLRIIWFRKCHPVLFYLLMFFPLLKEFDWLMGDWKEAYNNAYYWIREYISK